MAKLLLLFLVSGVLCAACVNDPEDDAKLSGPTQAIVGPDGLLYVGDGYYNSRIAVFSLDGKYIKSWGSKGYAHGQFNNPHGLAFAGNTLLVADRDNGRIQRFNLEGKYIDSWQSSSLGRPWAVAVADDGSVFVVDGGDQDDDNPHSAVMKLHLNGDVFCSFSSFGSGPEQLNEGHSIAVASTGDVFVADLQNKRVQKFSPLGSCNYKAETNWLHISAGTTFEPLGIATEGDKLYVAQQGEGQPILVFNVSSGELLSKIGAGLFKRAHGVFVDKEQTIWVTDVYGDCVYRLSKSGDVLLKIGG